jgi:hypothetical protein
MSISATGRIRSGGWVDGMMERGMSLQFLHDRDQLLIVPIRTAGGAPPSRVGARDSGEVSAAGLTDQWANIPRGRKLLPFREVLTANYTIALVLRSIVRAQGQMREGIVADFVKTADRIQLSPQNQANL